MNPHSSPCLVNIISNTTKSRRLPSGVFIVRRAAPNATTEPELLVARSPIANVEPRLPSAISMTTTSSKGQVVSNLHCFIAGTRTVISLNSPWSPGSV